MVLLAAHATRALNAMVERVSNRRLAELNRARTALGLDPLDRLLALTAAVFDFPAKLPANVRYVGLQLDDPLWERAVDGSARRRPAIRRPCAPPPTAGSSPSRRCRDPRGPWHVIMALSAGVPVACSLPAGTNLTTPLASCKAVRGSACPSGPGRRRSPPQSSILDDPEYRNAAANLGHRPHHENPRGAVLAELEGVRACAAAAEANP